MLSTLYSVTIAGVNNSAPNDGFVDFFTIEQYMAQGSMPSTYDQTTAKERANIRYKFLVQQLQVCANMYVTGWVSNGGSAIAAPTSVTFSLEIERGDSVLYTLDETANNAPLVGTDALVRLIARALCETRTTVSDVYDPTKMTTPGNSTQVARYGVRETTIVVGPAYSNLTAAANAITVTPR